MRWEKGKLIFGERKCIGYTERYEWGIGAFLGILAIVGVFWLIGYDAYQRRNDPPPVYYVNPGSFPGEWLGKTMTVNGKTLEITGYNSWRNHFNLSGGTIVEFSHPNLPRIKAN